VRSGRQLLGGIDCIPVAPVGPGAVDVDLHGFDGADPPAVATTETGEATVALDNGELTVTACAFTVTCMPVW